MIDKSDTTNAYGAAAALPSSQVPGVNSQPTLDEGPRMEECFPSNACRNSGQGVPLIHG